MTDKQDSRAGSSRWRSISLLLVGLLAGSLLLGTASAHLTTFNHVKKKHFYTKKLANKRFALRKSEPYHEVGTAGQPAFQNGWGNLGLGFTTAGFYKDSEGLVHLRGTLDGGSSGLPAFTLPAPYRPSAQLYLPMAAGDAGGPLAANMAIHTDGLVVPICGGLSCAGATVGMDGLVFGPVG